METIYLDNSATTPVAPEVLAAMMTHFGFSFGNPSSSHPLGIRAREAIEQARLLVASSIGADPGEIVFTGGGTEADNLAILGTAYAAGRGKDHIITSAIEHPAVLNACTHLAEKGFSVTCLPVDGRGQVDPDDVRKAITDRTFLITIMHANNEIGTVEPLAGIGALVRARGIYLHTDAVQTMGKIPVDVHDLNADLLSIAGHKFHGPKGVGALYIRGGTRISPLTFGGHQENGRRAGTENVPGIVGLGKACELVSMDLPYGMMAMKQMRDILQAKILHDIPDAHVNGDPLCRVPHILSVSLPGVAGDAVVREMAVRGIALSAGSACTSESTSISHVLAALGMPAELARGTIRFSLGRDNREEELSCAADALHEVTKGLRG